MDIQHVGVVICLEPPPLGRKEIQVEGFWVARISNLQIGVITLGGLIQSFLMYGMLKDCVKNMLIRFDLKKLPKSLKKSLTSGRQDFTFYCCCCLLGCCLCLCSIKFNFVCFLLGEIYIFSSCENIMYVDCKVVHGIECKCKVVCSRLN